MFLKHLFLVLGVFILCVQPLPAQQAASADEVIEQLYKSLTFNENQDPDYEAFRSLFVEGAQLISVRDTTSSKLTVGEFIDNMARQRSSGQLKAFREYEIHRETDRYGHIQHIFSTYETEITTSRGSLNTRGINSIQLLREKDRWKVASLIWYEENDNHPLPKEYLPH